jgi:hypothetical protein
VAAIQKLQPGAQQYLFEDSVGIGTYLSPAQMDCVFAVAKTLQLQYWVSPYLSAVGQKHFLAGVNRPYRVLCPEHLAHCSKDGFWRAPEQEERCDLCNSELFCFAV